jgi:hypothetical protein
MVKHIVMWKLKETAEGKTKEENAKIMVDMIHSLKESVPVVVDIEAGIDFNQSEAAYDVALYSVFNNKEALHIYQEHPEHLKVAEFINKVRESRVVVDYEI